MNPQGKYVVCDGKFCYVNDKNELLDLTYQLESPQIIEKIVVLLNAAATWDIEAIRQGRVKFQAAKEHP